MPLAMDSLPPTPTTAPHRQHQESKNSAASCFCSGNEENQFHVFNFSDDFESDTPLIQN